MIVHGIQIDSEEVLFNDIDDAADFIKQTLVQLSSQERRNFILQNYEMTQEEYDALPASEEP